MLSSLPPHLVSNLQSTIFKALSPSTCNTYGANILRFNEFCDKHSIPEKDRCNNETEAALCAASETRCSPSESGSTERCSSCFGRTRRRCFKVGGEKMYIMTNYVAIYSVPRVLHACYSVRDVSDAESRGPSGPRSEVQSPEGFSIDSSIAGIGTLHWLRSFKC